MDFRYSRFFSPFPRNPLYRDFTVLPKPFPTLLPFELRPPDSDSATSLSELYDKQLNGYHIGQIHYMGRVPRAVESLARVEAILTHLSQ